MNLSFDEFKTWELKFANVLEIHDEPPDPSHDLIHFKRVVKIAKQLTLEEKANPWIVIPAAWLHDFVNVPKNSPLRSQASKLSADKAVQFLKEAGYPQQYFDQIHHAIVGHSFSANVEVETIEAKIVQDADRLDGLGAVGLSRCFVVAGRLGRSLYSEEDPFCEFREPDDLKYTIDHFYQKLFKVAKSLKTKSGQIEGQRRIDFMKIYLEQLKTEIV